jgi:hypothetical protein
VKHRYVVTFAGKGHFYEIYFGATYILRREDIEELKYECVEKSKEDITVEELVVINIYKFEESPNAQV